MLDPPLLGRESELRAIDRFFERLGEGPALLSFEGDPGIGKTTLLRATVRRAREDGIRVLAAAGAVAESRLSYVALTDLLSEVGSERIAGLPDPQLEALDAALLRAHPPSRSWSWEAVAAAVRSLMTGLLDEGPLVVVIDDIQWIDSSSARVIEFCTRRLGGEFGIVFSRRSGSETWRPEIADRSGATTQYVTPLDTPAVARMLRRHAREPLTRRALTRIAAAAGGNPLYALELLRALPPGEVSTGPLALPPTLRDMVATRLTGLGGQVEELLLAVAALADPTLEVLGDALGTDVPLLIARAEDQGVLELRGRRVRFTHPLLAEGTLAHAPASRRRAMHRCLSEVVTDPEDRARHLALGAVLPDALPALVDAARSARSRGAPAAGAELLELAIDLGGNTALKVCAAELHLDSGDVQRADALVHEAMGALAPGHDRARAQSLLAELRVRHDSFVEARELLEQAREEAEEDSPLQVSIGLQLTFVLYSLGLRQEAADCADAALALAEKLAIPGLLAQALGAAATTDFAIGRGVDEGRLRRGLFLEDPDTWSSAALHPAVTASMVLGFTGRLGEAVDLLERLRKEYDQRGEEHDLAWLGTRLSWFECWRGNLDAAEQHVMEASDRLLALGTTVGRMLALTAQAQLDAHAGRADSARKGAEDALALADETDWHGAMTWQHMTLGFLELSLGDPDAAAVRLAPLAAEAIESGLPEPAADGALVHGDAAEALILVGRVSEAAPLVELLEQRGKALNRTWAIAVGARCRGLLLAAGGDVDGAQAALERALKAHESLPMPIERGRTLLALGRVQRRLRERRAAKKTLEQSLAIFEGVGSKLWADQARGELAAIGLRAGPPDELTASEERVARLAATGLTNRQIAASLQVSPKTVETHLGRVYRKLDIRTRAELGARMGGGRPGS